MKIGVFEIEEWEKHFFTDAFGQANLFFSQETLSEENSKEVENAEVLSIFIYSQLTRELLEKLPNLKCIVTRSTGFDHIDTEYCKENGIVICNVPQYGAHSVAEQTFALLLAISRQLPSSLDRTRKGNFDLTGLTGFDLYGKTLGIIGFGSIGKNVCAIATGFGMKVIAFTENPKPEDAETYHVKFVELSELLQGADIITLHLPLTPQTTHILNHEAFSQMKKGVILLNTARGGLIDTESLVDALESGVVKAAGLDVLEEECMIKEERQLLSKHFLKECNLETQLLNHVLLMKENVLVTPHNAFNSQESLHTILRTTVENIQGYLTQKPIHTI